MSRRTQDRITGAIIPISILLVTAAVAILGFWISTLPAESAKLLAFIATVLVVPGVLVGFALGKLEAKGRLTGLDQGIERLGKVAVESTKLGVAANRATRAPSMPIARREIMDLPVDPPWSDSPPLLESGMVKQV